MKKQFYVFFYHWGNSYQVWVEDQNGYEVWWNEDGKLIVDRDFQRGNAYNGGNTEILGLFRRKAEVETALALVDARIQQWEKEDRDFFAEMIRQREA